VEDGSHHALDLFVSPKPVVAPDVCVCNGFSVLVDSGLMPVPPDEVGAVKKRDHRGAVESKVMVEGFQDNGVYEYPENLR